MQVTQYQPKFIEKIVATESGQFLARFVLVAGGNSFKLRLVSMVPIDDGGNSLNNKVFLLVAPRPSQIYHQILRSSVEIISPYSKLLFFISQPTRAPSFV